MLQAARHPIGVFDSGVGGLTVAKALHELLPHEDILYFGDTARVPYGVKSVSTIEHYSAQIADFLIERQVKLLIVACNTMAAVAIDVIQARSPVPVLDVLSAGAWHAARTTQNKAVAVIGTPATVGSGAYEKLIKAQDPSIVVFSQACPLFVPLVEEGWLDHPVTRLTISEYLNPLMRHGMDTLVLGCTHYPLLKPVIQSVVGEQVSLIDSATTVAVQARVMLEEQNLANPQNGQGQHEYFVTDVPARFAQVGERFMGRPIEPVTTVSW